MPDSYLVSYSNKIYKTDLSLNQSEGFTYAFARSRLPCGLS
jgi:hypothetical protein